MTETESITPRQQKLADLLITHTTTNVPDFVSLIGKIAEAWQKDDRKREEDDYCYVLNSVRIVEQVWFRGHSSCEPSLKPGLYRDSTRKGLQKADSSPKPTKDFDTEIFNELFELEHSMRISFQSYGRLLNSNAQSLSDIDWYFTMQHHGVPTRLLDWTTNALAALFFAVDELRKNIENEEKILSMKADGDSKKHTVCVWMMDAYWLADHSKSDWYAPLLPWSEDAKRYIPSLETMIENQTDAEALLPRYPMPIEPSAIHPRVAAQEGRFIIFGKNQELLDEEIVLGKEDDGTKEESRIVQIKFEVADVHLILRNLAQLGVSMRTLFPDLAGLADFVRWNHTHKVTA